MILVRSPLRLTFGGGGSDLLSYSKRFGGFCISAAIDKYSYISVNRTFKEEIILKYSELERVKKADKIKHPIFKAAIEMLFKTPQIEVCSIADFPSAGIGLGGSGSFTVALIKALCQYKNISTLPGKVADIACDINIEVLKKAQGKQDEYISAYGGINCLEFETSGNVVCYPVRLSYDSIIELEDSLMLFYSGLKHDSEEILKDQEKKTNDNDAEIISNLNEVKQLGYDAKNFLEKRRLNDFGELLNIQWENKRKRVVATEDAFLDEIHYGLLQNGAIGNKIIGSGAGGCFMAYAEDKKKLRKYMKEMQLEEIRFGFDFSGVKQII